MAADGVEEIKLTLVRADKTYPINLNLSECEIGGTICVRHVAEEIERLTKIKRSNQRIIFNGRELCDDNCTLSILGIRDGCHIHVLKKEYDPDMVKPDYKIDILEKELRNQDKHLNCLIHRFDVMQKDLIPCLCSCENIMELMCSLQECQNNYGLLEEKLIAMETEDENLVKRKQKLLCRIQIKLRCNENMLIAVNDVIVRMNF